MDKSGEMLMPSELNDLDTRSLEVEKKALLENTDEIRSRPQDRNEGARETSSNFYIVEEGDTLIRISMKLNISMARLKKYNHLFGKNDVMVGQMLRLIEKPEVHEKPFISLKDSKLNSSFREREILKQQSAHPYSKKSSDWGSVCGCSPGFGPGSVGGVGGFLTPLQISETDEDRPVSSTVPQSTISSFRYKAISDPNLCSMHLSIEDEIHIFPRRRSAWNLDREREFAVSINNSDEDFAFLDFDLTEEEKAALQEIPAIPGLAHLTPQTVASSEMTTPSLVLRGDLLPVPIPASSSSPAPPTTPQLNVIQRLRSVSRQITVPPLAIDIGSINSQIFTHSHILSLLRHLPLSLQNDSWKLLYSILLYGDDLSSFFQCAADSKYTLLVVKTRDGQIFGGFGTEPWRVQKTHMFYGTGESFVFMIHGTSLPLPTMPHMVLTLTCPSLSHRSQ
jgi:LysM repeat protein